MNSFKKMSARSIARKRLEGIALLLAILMLSLSFAACNNGSETTPELSEPTEPIETPADTPESTTEEIVETEEPEEISIDMRVMSFNIRCNEFTPERIDLVIHMIKTYKPDTVGFQEATDAWVETLAERLGDEYGYVSCGRNANRKGEASPVFYLKSRFKAIESDTKWMSDTPDVAGSKVEQSSLPRIFTYVMLEDIESGKQFIHVNTHLEHTAETARVAQVKVLINYLKTFDEREIPYVLTGDFNATVGSQSYTRVLSYGLANSSFVAKTAERGYTYHGYGTTGSIIDYIFINASTTTVDYYKVCNETFTSASGSIAYPSDHNPIIADITIKG